MKQTERSIIVEVVFDELPEFVEEIKKIYKEL